MTLDELAQFPAIAWDVDATLVGNPHAGILFRFIVDHPEIQHSIVTFRSHGYQDSAFDEIEAAGGPSRNCFVRLLNASDRLWLDDNTAKTLRRSGQLKGQLTACELAYRHWKGFACSQHGIPVLVDDDTANCKPGCDRHGIVLVHPEDIRG